MIRALLLLLLSSAATAAPVKVGCLYPLSGAGGLYGRDSLVAIGMAQQHLRDRGGYPELEILVEDSRSKTLRSLQIARRFVEEDQVDFLCGIVSSAVALTVSDYARQSDTFFIGTDHASPQLVSSQGHVRYFRVSNGSRQSMRAGALYIGEHHRLEDKPLRIAFIGPDYNYAYDSWRDMRHFLAEQKIDVQITGTYWPKLFEEDYRLYIRQLLHDAPDILINAHWGLDLVNFVRQADQLGLFQVTQFMNFDTGGNFEILAELGSDMPADLVMSARHHLNWPDTPANRKFVSDFRVRAGRYPSYAAQGAWSGVLAIAEAVRLAGGTEDKAALQIALEGLQLTLPEDPLDSPSRMDASSHQMLQSQAIGKTQADNRFPPAAMMLGDFSVYAPPAVWPDF